MSDFCLTIVALLLGLFFALMIYLSPKETSEMELEDTEIGLNRVRKWGLYAAVVGSLITSIALIIKQIS
jgi:hypothetical protein